MKNIIVAIFAIGLVAGCDFELIPYYEQPDSGEVGLTKFKSADELKSYLVNHYNETTYTRWGADENVAADVDAAESDDMGAGMAPAPTAADAQDGTNLNGDSEEPAHSNTTEQEEGVQESDIIKNDGDYLYVLSRGVLRIVQANPADGMTELSSVDTEGSGRDLYLVDGRVVAITTPDYDYSEAASARQEEKQFIDIMPYFYRPQVEITVVDVSNPGLPQVLSKSLFDGSVTASRMIGTDLHLVIANYPEYAWRFAESTNDTLADLELDDILPAVSIEVYGVTTVEGVIGEFDDFYRPLDPDGVGITSVVSFDIETPDQYVAQSVVAYPSNVYSSTEALYLTDNDYDNLGDIRTHTDIYKFDYNSNGPEFVASGSVSGRVLNQYSMSEYNGYLRIATTDEPIIRWAFDIDGGDDGSQEAQEPTNNVFVLEQVGDALQVVGSVEDLAPGETIYSARFIGDKGYLVTFEQIDPLFTFDLSDPYNPVAVGELKVPGFSNFLVPMDDNHLLAVGQSTTDEYGWTQPIGIQISIFDVSDFANPQLAYSEIIGEEGTYSEALYNPKAFTYFAERNLLAFPVEIYNWNDAVFLEEPDVLDFGDDGSASGSSDGVEVPEPTDVTTSGIAAVNVSTAEAGTNGVIVDTEVDTNGTVPTGEGDDIIGISDIMDDYFIGLYVYRVTPDAGFEYLGRISTIAQDVENYWYWGPEFTRGAFIEDNVYAVTSDGVYSASVDDVDTILSTVDFPLPEYEYIYPAVDEMVRPDDDINTNATDVDDVPDRQVEDDD